MKTRSLVFAATLLTLPLAAPAVHADGWRDRGPAHSGRPHNAPHATPHAPRHGHSLHHARHGHAHHWGTHTAHHRHHYHRPPVVYYGRPVVIEQHRHSRLVPIVAGGMLGGVLARELSHGDEAAIVAGTLFGAVLANEAAR